MDISQLIAEHGAFFYLIAFVWTFLEGETFVLFAAFAAAQGLLNPALLLAATWLGSFCSTDSRNGGTVSNRLCIGSNGTIPALFSRSASSMASEISRPLRWDL